MPELTASHDRIYIRDLQLRCTVGHTKEERIEEQDILVTVVLFTDIKNAAVSDRLKDTVDYVVVKRIIMDAVEKKSFHLVETIAERISEVCLEDRRVQEVIVTVDKPGALPLTRSVAVEITRSRS